MKISIGNIKIGQGEKIAIQSMTNVIASDTEKTIRQINELAAAGCDIVRFAVPDEECAKAVSTIKEKTNIPLVADIHFDYRLALMCIERGIDKVRINPGNIGGEDRAKAVLLAAKEKGIPVPEPKTETMKKDRAKKAEEEKESADGEAEDREEKEVSGATEADADNKTSDADDTNEATESTQSTSDDDSDDSDSEGPVLTGKDADFASELKNRLYK